MNIVGNYQKVQEPEGPNLHSRGYSKEALLELERQMHEQGKSTKYRCLNLSLPGPLNQYCYPLLGYVVTLHKSFTDNGVLPFSGPLADQPAKIIEIFNTLDSLNHENETRIREQQERENKRKNGKR